MYRITALIFLLFANVAQAQTYVQQGGSTGADFSFISKICPIAGSVLSCTVPANPQRYAVTIQNQQNSGEYVCLDNGSNSSPNSLIILSPYTGTATDGNNILWSSTTFKGRVRVYGPSGTSQVSCHED